MNLIEAALEARENTLKEKEEWLKKEFRRLFKKTFGINLKYDDIVLDSYNRFTFDNITFSVSKFRNLSMPEEVLRVEMINGKYLSPTIIPYVTKLKDLGIILNEAGVEHKNPYEERS